jgi:ERF superfamily
MTEQLEITDKDLNVKLPAKGERESRGLGNGSPVEPSSLSESKSTFRYSPTLGELCKSLCLACQQFPEITKDTENPYFRSQYTDLATLIKATRPVLAKHGLVVIQAPQAANKGVRVTTMLMHSSGEWIASDLELPAKVSKPKKAKPNGEYDEEGVSEPSNQELRPDAQALGSAITYARRYSYQAILNIAGEEDDDGNAAVGRTQKDYQSRSTEVGAGRVNPVQLRAFQSACKTGKKTAQQALDYMGTLGHETEEDLLKSELDEAIRWALAK